MKIVFILLLVFAKYNLQYDKIIIHS